MLWGCVIVYSLSCFTAERSIRIHCGDVPFISAIADLEGGGTVKTNMVGIDPDPEKITLGMNIEITYGIAPRKDGEGNEYMTYYISPAA